jgi:hypothetical protein
MGRSIERQDGEDFERCVSGHFQIGAAPDTSTDRQRKIFHYHLIKCVYRLHIETVFSLFFYNKTLLYLLTVLWLFLEFLHIKEINKEKSDILDEHQCSVKTFNDTGFGLLVVSGKEVHVVFLEKLLKYSVGKFSSFVCL